MSEMERPLPPDGARNANPEGMSFWALVKEDFVTHERNWTSQGFWAVFWHRFGNWRMSLGCKLVRAPTTLLYRTMFKACEIFGGIMLPYSMPIGRRVKIEHFGGIVLSARRIGDDVIIRQNTTMGVARTTELAGKPVIGNGVDIGVGAVILGQVTVSDGAVIGANAVVLTDVPKGALVVGVPARIVQRRKYSEQDA